MSQFVDQVKIKVGSGDGGNGMVAWRREKYEPLGGPAGGNGGRGGHVFLQASADMSTLLDFHYKKEFKASPGEKGGPKNRHGKHGKDLFLKLPVGTLVRDAESQAIIADLTVDGQQVLVAEGGRGGRGNVDLQSQRNKAPYYCEPGEVGISRELELELKLLADVGIAGLPNAGKSTLLSVLTAARPKIADYPFSTLRPNLGVVRNPSGDGFVMADIPGPVEGASQGVGLGHKFLRHIERTRLIVHLADISDQSLEHNIAVIARELYLYNQHLAELPRIVVLNKTDLLPPESTALIKAAIESRLNELLDGSQAVKAVLLASCATTDGIEALRKRLLEELSNLPLPCSTHHIVEDTAAHERKDEGFSIVRRKKAFFVSGVRVERLVSVTNLRSPESLHHLFDVLRAMGIIEALIKEGAQPGSEVFIGDTSFAFGEEMS